MGAEPSSQAADRRFRLALVAILLIAAAFRFFRLGADSYWADEAYTVRIATREGAQAFWWPDQTPPLYIALLHLWTFFVGDGEAQVRGLSVAFGLLAILFSYALAARVYGRNEALLSAAILALLVPMTHFSREARTYSLFVAATAATYLAFTRVQEVPSQRRAAAFVVPAAAMLYSHVFGLLMMGALFATHLLQRPRVPLRIAATVFLGPLLLFLPWSLTLVERTRAVLSSFWIPRPTLDSVGNALETLAGSALLAYLLWLLALYGAFKVRRERAGIPRDPEALRLLAPWLLLPPVTAILASLVGRPIFDAKYVLPIVVPLTILAARGLLTTVPPRLKAGAIAVVILLLGATLVGFLAHPARDDWRGATRYLEQEAKPRDLIVFNEGLCDSRIDDDHQCAFELYTERSDLRLFPFLPDWKRVEESDLVLLDRALANETRFWLFKVHHGDPRGLIEPHVEQRFQANASVAFHGIRIIEYVRSG